MDPGFPSDTLLVCADAFRRRIVIGRSRWEGHLQTRHREVFRHLDAVRLSLERPDRVTRDAKNPDGINYYRMAALPPPYHRLYLKVCVSFHRSDHDGPVGGFVTAYPTKGIGRGEEQRWP
jgi:hypothetical protein